MAALVPASPELSFTSVGRPTAAPWAALPIDGSAQFKTLQSAAKVPAKAYVHHIESSQAQSLARLQLRALDRVADGGLAVDLERSSVGPTECAPTPTNSLGLVLSQAQQESDSFERGFYSALFADNDEDAFGFLGQPALAVAEESSDSQRSFGFNPCALLNSPKLIPINLPSQDDHCTFDFLPTPPSSPADALSLTTAAAGPSRCPPTPRLKPRQLPPVVHDSVSLPDTPRSEHRPFADLTVAERPPWVRIKFPNMFE